MAVMQALKESLPVYSSEEKNKKFSSSASTVLKVLWSILSTIVCLKWMNAGISLLYAYNVCSSHSVEEAVYSTTRRERHHDEAACKNKKKREEIKMTTMMIFYNVKRERDFITTTRMSDEYNKHYYHILLCRY